MLKDVLAEKLEDENLENFEKLNATMEIKILDGLIESG